jgi:hypothetical protein
MPSLYLVLIDVQRLLLLLAELLLLDQLLHLQLLVYHLQLLVVLPLLLPLQVLHQVVLLDLPVTHQLLLLNHSLDLLTLLPLLPSQVVLVLPDHLEVIQVRTLGFLLGVAVVLHLLLELFSHPSLVVPDFGLNSIFFFLELFNVVHNNLGPVVWVLRRRVDGSCW